MDATTILIGIGVLVAVLLVVSVVVRLVLMRPVIAATIRARETVTKNYEFTTSVPAQRVIDAIELRWGRTVPDGEAGFYVESVMGHTQVIVVFGSQSRPRIFAADIRFESADPAAGTLWFSEAKYMAAGTEAAERLRAEFAALIADLSPGAEVRERDGESVILTWDPGPDSRHQPPRHRRERQRQDEGEADAGT